MTKKRTLWFRRIVPKVFDMKPSVWFSINFHNPHGPNFLVELNVSLSIYVDVIFHDQLIRNLYRTKNVSNILKILHCAPNLERNKADKNFNPAALFS